jgi:3-deoxy-D-manno-octulosonate 8-phosphate phosphatase KdsC-like HAD superfamily phosphatase
MKTGKKIITWIVSRIYYKIINKKYMKMRNCLCRYLKIEVIWIGNRDKEIVLVREMIKIKQANLVITIILKS